MAIESGTAIVLAYLLVSIGLIVAFVGAVFRTAARAPPQTARRRVTYRAAVAR